MKKTGIGNEELQFFNQPEGYIEPDNGDWNYVYQYKDHLGNIRLSYQDKNNDGVITAATEIVEENNYYLFGLKHKGYNTNHIGRDHKYGFGNKEEQDELGLGWIDITARNYDPALGRWMNIDPLADQMRRHSPYNYVFDNPIYFTDPDGMKSRPGGFDEAQWVDDGFDDLYSSVTIYGESGGPITLGTSGTGSKKKGKKKSNPIKVFTTEEVRSSGDSDIFNLLDVVIVTGKSKDGIYENGKNGGKTFWDDIKEESIANVSGITTISKQQFDSKQLENHFYNNQKSFGDASNSLAIVSAVSTIASYKANPVVATIDGVAAYESFRTSSVASSYRNLQHNFNHSGLEKLWLVTRTNTYINTQGASYTSTVLSYYIPNGGVFATLRY